MITGLTVKALSVGLTGCILAALTVVSDMNLAYGSDIATMWQDDPLVTTITGERITDLVLANRL